MPDISHLVIAKFEIDTFKTIDYFLRGVHLIRTHDLQRFFVLGAIEDHIVRRHLMRHRNREHRVGELPPIAHNGIVAFSLPVESEILVKGLGRCVRHVLHIIRSDSYQYLQRRVDITILSFIDVLMHLIQCLIYIASITLLLNLNDRQAVDKQCCVEAPVLLPCYFCWTLDLVHYLVNRIACANLALIEYREKHMATVIEIDLNL